MKKAILVLTTLLLLTGVMFAGGRQETGTADMPKEVDITFFMFATGDETVLWEELTAAVSIDYPDITVTGVYEPWFVYWDKMAIMSASGQMPADIVTLQSLRAPQYYELNQYISLKKYYENDPEIRLDDFDSEVLNSLSHNGEIMGFPYDVAPYGVFFNIDLFDEYNVPYPDDKDTWETFLEKLKGVSIDGNYGIGIVPATDWIVTWLWGAGGDYADPQTKEYTIVTPENIKGLQFVSDMFNVSKVALPFTDPGAGGAFIMENFSRGIVGSFIWGPWNLQRQTTFKMGVAPVPIGPAGRFSPSYGSGLHVNINSEYPEESYQAIKSMIGTPSQIKLAEAGRGLPGRVSAQSSFYEKFAHILGIDTFEISGQRDGKEYIAAPMFAQFARIVHEEVALLIIGRETDAEKVLRAIEARVKNLEQE